MKAQPIAMQFTDREVYLIRRALVAQLDNMAAVSAMLPAHAQYSAGGQVLSVRAEIAHIAAHLVDEEERRIRPIVPIDV